MDINSGTLQLINKMVSDVQIPKSLAAWQGGKAGDTASNHEESDEKSALTEVVQGICDTKFDIIEYATSDWWKSIVVNGLTFAAGVLVALALIFQNDYLNGVTSLSINFGRDLVILIGIGAGIETAKQVLSYRFSSNN